MATIQNVQNNWFNATHQNTERNELEKENAINTYSKLAIIIELFLNTKLGRNKDDEATLFGFPLGQANFSDGQKILLQFCMAIFSQETALKDLILVLDEPENHLHPSVIIEVIERIIKCVPDGQIWIATHSIPILAHFDPNCIWFMENNRIRHAGKIPEQVLQSLLGSEEEISKLQDFIGLPAQFATNSYAFESLFEPAVVETNANDPQSKQIRSILLENATAGKVKILDYGVGKGRLISNIADLDKANQEKLLDSIDYVAFDKYDTDKENCQANLTKVFGNSENKYFNDETSLLTKYDKGSFDVVIMCNVLHEIDPKDWISLFKKDGEISKLLKDTGYLLLVEDQRIPNGEKAYEKGFLVLDTPQLKDLFRITEKDQSFIVHDQRGDGRLKAHFIPKAYLTRIDKESRLDSIKNASDNAKSQILNIRKKNSDFQNGKLHGFWTQQFANAQLILAELEG